MELTNISRHKTSYTHIVVNSATWIQHHDQKTTIRTFSKIYNLKTLKSTKTKLLSEHLRNANIFGDTYDGHCNANYHIEPF